jgi:uncharacterized protein YgiM (DUF1202 family)
MKKFLQGLSKLFLGVLLALLVMSLAGLAAARYVLTRLSSLPERPVFDNDAPIETAEAPASEPAKPVAKSEAEAPAPPEAAKDAESVAPAVAETPPENPTAEPEEKPEEALPAGAYQAVVVQSLGLVMRSGPGTSYSSIGGVDYEDNLVVLAEDNGWLKVRSDNGREGWVKGGGNTQRLDNQASR